MSYVRPTPRQRELLAAYVEERGLAPAARRLGITYGTAGQTLHAMRRRTGLSTEQAIALGMRDGWLCIHIS